MHWVTLPGLILDDALLVQLLRDVQDQRGCGVRQPPSDEQSHVHLLDWDRRHLVRHVLVEDDKVPGWHRYPDSSGIVRCRVLDLHKAARPPLLFVRAFGERKVGVFIAKVEPAAKYVVGCRRKGRLVTVPAPAGGKRGQQQTSERQYTPNNPL